MKTVGAYEAKTHLPALLEEVAGGQRITITKHGVPVAMLVPPESVEKPDVKDVFKEMRELRKGMKLRGLSVRKMREEGRS